ncbi:hypothetical protein RB595_000443 [Gaeumannomyces hyphopodioides]
MLVHGQARPLVALAASLLVAQQAAATSLAKTGSSMPLPGVSKLEVEGELTGSYSKPSLDVTAIDAIDAALWDVLPAVPSRVDLWHSGLLPLNCAAYHAESPSLSPGFDFSVYNMFGRLPIRMHVAAPLQRPQGDPRHRRRRHRGLAPAPHAELAGPAQVGGGSGAGSGGELYSATARWREAERRDAAVATAYSLTNWVEHFAEMAGPGLLEAARGPGAVAAAAGRDAADRLSGQIEIWNNDWGFLAAVADAGGQGVGGTGCDVRERLPPVEVIHNVL